MNDTFEHTIRKTSPPEAGAGIPEPVIRYFRTHAHATTPPNGTQSGGSRSAAQKGAEMAYGQCFIMEQPLNNIQKIDEYLAVVNENMSEGARILGSVHTVKQLKAEVLNRYRLGFYYFVLTVLIRQALSRSRVLSDLYFRPKPGRNWVLSDIEAFGRLFAAGFSLESTMEEEGMVYFIAKKTGKPHPDLRGCSAAVIRLPRVGKGGKMITIYKLRTMYPYSQFLQEYVFNTNGLQDGGKFRDDPRVTPIGRILRKCFLDELPNIVNMLRGEVKLFGVRAISEHYLSLFPAEFKAYRRQFKPGVIPPEYVGMPKTLDEIIQVEWDYLKAYEKSPLWTDVKYLSLAILNILFKGARSH